MSGYLKIPIISGGGGGSVDSVNGQTGDVVLTKSDVGLGNVTNTSDANKPVSTAQQTALDLKANIASPTFTGTVSGITASMVGLGNVDNTSDINKPISTDTQSALDLKLDDSNIATNNQVIYQNGSGAVEGFPDFYKDGTNGGIQFNANRQPNNQTGQSLHNYVLNLDPLQNSPDEKWTLVNNSINFDINNSGFNQGSNGNGCTVQNNNIANVNTGNNGDMNFINNYFNLGNGTDAVSARGFSYAYGFGNINANATINGPMQGYGYQPSFNVAAIIDPAAYTVAFYDFANIDCASPNYTSFNIGTSIAEIMNNNYYTGIQINPTIDNFEGNAGYTALNISGNLGTFDTGSFSGINVNPTIDNVNYAQGIYVSMDNVTVSPGAPSELVIQDLTLTFNTNGDNNNFTIEYVDDTTSGSESVDLTAPTIVVHIESGVTDADTIKAVLEANFTINGAMTIVVTGTGSDPQVTQAATNFINGVNPGNKKAAYFDGDVEITGALTFGGALSIGQLNAFATYPVVSGSGNPSSSHLLITQPTLAANESRTLADYLGVNTAMLLNMGDNSSITTGFIGMTALGLPAVVTMGVGSTIDLVTGATFALSLDASATGGTIDQLSLCRAVVIPNGATTVTRQYGYEFDNPFGDAGVTTWGFYSKLNCHNYFAGNLMIGGTAGSDDTVENNSVGLELKSTTKAILSSRMSTTEKNSLTALAGMIVYDLTLNQLSYYNGTTWVDL